MEDKKTIKVDIDWSDKNYAYGWGFPDFGAIIGTADTLDKAKAEFKECLIWQIEEMLKDSLPVPSWLAEGRYEIEYVLSASAMLRDAERFTTMAAISRVTGINQKLLSHYASALRRPRPRQRQRIVEGLHQIGRTFLSF